VRPADAPEWARWAEPATPLTVGVEEEVMLVERDGWALHQDADGVLASLGKELRARASTETHASALELSSGVHVTAAAATAELASLRGALARDLRSMGLAAASAGLHPFTTWEETVVSGGARYRALRASLRALAEREPTFALHVHVAIPGAEEAVSVLNALRHHLPLLLALSANSPFWQGRDSGMAAMRVPVFHAFPRSGTPRAFASYAEWVARVDALIRPGAIPDPSHLWWDVRLQPGLGTVEVRIMDAQTAVGDTAALVALVQCLAARVRSAPRGPEAPDEVLAENRFLAARDGMRARFVDPRRGELVPAELVLETVLLECEPHAADLGCAAELARVTDLAADTGAERQRAEAAAGGARGIVAALAAAFAAGAGDGEPAAPAAGAPLPL
jgi:glutamate---cysteine ligase / carboxylate-amine ligase